MPCDTKYKSCSCCGKLFHAENLNKWERCEQCEFEIQMDIENQLERENYDLIYQNLDKFYGSEPQCQKSNKHN